MYTDTHTETNTHAEMYTQIHKTPSEACIDRDTGIATQTKIHSNTCKPTEAHVYTCTHVEIYTDTQRDTIDTDTHINTERLTETHRYTETQRDIRRHRHT